jgi:hypothetical protein
MIVSGVIVGAQEHRNATSVQKKAEFSLSIEHVSRHDSACAGKVIPFIIFIS